MELSKIKGLGEKTIQYLNQLNIYDSDDLIRNYPYRFNVYAKRSINDDRYYDNFVSDGIVESPAVINFFRGKMNRITFRCNIQNKIIRVVIFNRAFLKNKIVPGRDRKSVV